MLADEYNVVSDKRLKHGIVTIPDALDKIIGLNGYLFTWNKNDERDMGIIAQEVEKVFPEIVRTHENGYKSVEYGNLVAPLIESIKTLDKQIQEPQVKVDQLEQKK